MAQPHLTVSNKDELLSRLKGKNKDDAERLIVAFAPRPEPGDSMRLLPRIESPVPSAADEPSAAELPKPEIIRPVSNGRVQISFAADEKVREMLKRIRGLLRHKYPEGRLEEIVAELARDFLERRDHGREPRPSGREPYSNGRAIPAAVKRAVWRRDGGRCGYVADDGRRCEAVEWLEYDHVKAWALGGSSEDPDNIRLLCRAHNAFEVGRAGLTRICADSAQGPLSGPKAG